MAIGSLKVGSDNVIQLDALVDQSDGNYLNAATVTVTLLKDDGTDVVGDTWPLTMNYVTSSNGRYTATLIDSLTLVPNRRYIARVTADAGAGKLRTWYHSVHAVRG